MSSLWLANLLGYCLQVAVLVTAAVCVTRVLSLRDARLRVVWWQSVLAVAVALPAVGWWTARDASEGAGPLLLVGAVASRAITAGTSGIDWASVVLAMLIAGACLRLGWMLLGWIVIRGYVRRATPVPHAQVSAAMPAGFSAEVRLSDDVASPATVGHWRPVVLVPPRLFELPVAAQRAVLCHEHWHIRRRDWLRTVGEEAWCAVLWFHPLARVLVTRVDLAREMLVDRQSIAETADRQAYARALLAFGSATDWSRGAATCLIRKSHVSDRIAALAGEVPMSRRRTVAAVVVACLFVPGATISAVHLLPMATGAPQANARVTLPTVVREVKPEYTPAAMEAKIEGAVLLEVVVQADGTVGSVRVTRSLDTTYGLDQAAAEAASQWLFEPGRLDGEAVEVAVTLELRFTLR